MYDSQKQCQNWFLQIFYFSLTNHEVINLYKVICTETILCFCSFVIKLVSGTVCSVSATSLAICVANTSFFLSIHYLLFLSHNKFRIINVIKKDFMWEFEFQLPFSRFLPTCHSWLVPSPRRWNKFKQNEKQTIFCEFLFTINALLLNA